MVRVKGFKKRDVVKKKREIYIRGSTKAAVCECSGVISQENTHGRVQF